MDAGASWIAPIRSCRRSSAPLEDEHSTQPAELALTVGIIEPGEQDPLDRSLDPDAEGYPSVHGAASFCNRQGSPWSLRSLHFSSGFRTPPT